MCCVCVYALMPKKMIFHWDREKFVEREKQKKKIFLLSFCVVKLNNFPKARNVMRATIQKFAIKNSFFLCVALLSVKILIFPTFSSQFLCSIKQAPGGKVSGLERNEYINSCSIKCQGILNTITPTMSIRSIVQQSYFPHYLTRAVIILRRDASIPAAINTPISIWSETSDTSQYKYCFTGSQRFNWASIPSNTW